MLQVMLLLALVLYLYAVLGVWNFGANDPVHFDSVGVAMLTLFRCATLANWKEVYEINYWGCDRFPAERYAAAARLEHFSANGFGRFPRWQCSRPEGNPVRAAAFFVTFSIIAAFVIISLFVGVITLGMFTALEEQRDRKASAICAVLVLSMPARWAMPCAHDRKASAICAVLVLSFHACPVGDAMCARPVGRRR
jgi:ABC-type sugar transport system permease subunit